jgi:hypothetical protein
MCEAIALAIQDSHQESPTVGDTAEIGIVTNSPRGPCKAVVRVKAGAILDSPRFEALASGLDIPPLVHSK